MNLGEKISHKIIEFDYLIWNLKGFVIVVFLPSIFLLPYPKKLVA